MGRPSIFSSDYKKKMRARRLRMTFLTVIIVIGAAAVFFRASIKTSIMGSFSRISIPHINISNLITSKGKNVLGQFDKNSETASIKEKDDKTKVNGTDDKKGTDSKPEEKNEAVEKFYELKMNDGRVVKVAYEEQGADKKIKYASAENNLYFNISPSAKGIVILDEKTQDMFFMDNNGKSVDISKTQYVSSSGEANFNKNEEITRDPNYIWHLSPKFIDEENIVYISNLPWFTDSKEKYIWMYKLSTKEHVNILRTGSTSLIFDKLTERGLQINVDGKVKYIQPGGEIVE